MKQWILMGMVAMMVACQVKTQTTVICDQTIEQAVNKVLEMHPEADSSMVARGAVQVAALWPG